MGPPQEKKEQQRLQPHTSPLIITNADKWEYDFKANLKEEYPDIDQLAPNELLITDMEERKGGDQRKGDGRNSYRGHSSGQQPGSTDSDQHSHSRQSSGQSSHGRSPSGQQRTSLYPLPTQREQSPRLVQRAHGDNDEQDRRPQSIDQVLARAPTETARRLSALGSGRLNAPSSAFNTPSPLNMRPSIGGQSAMGRDPRSQNVTHTRMERSQPLSPDVPCQSDPRKRIASASLSPPPHHTTRRNQAAGVSAAASLASLPITSMGRAVAEQRQRPGYQPPQPEHDEDDEIRQGRTPARAPPAPAPALSYFPSAYPPPSQLPSTNPFPTSALVPTPIVAMQHTTAMPLPAILLSAPTATSAIPPQVSAVDWKSLRATRPQTARPWSCTAAGPLGCHLWFTRKDVLEQHYKDVHEGIKPYYCTVCGKYFSRRDNFNTHKKNMGH